MAALDDALPEVEDVTPEVEETVADKALREGGLTEEDIARITGKTVPAPGSADAIGQIESAWWSGIR